MPATNRVPTPAGATVMSPGYLRAQGPAWAKLQAGLALFAIAVIVRYCVQRARSWWLGRRRSRVEAAAGLQESLERPRWLATDEKPRQATMTSAAKAQDTAPAQEELTARETGPAAWRNGSDSLPRHIVPRLPPAPPLTPPELSTAVFTIDAAPHRHDSFIHQPNPDYMSSTSSIAQTGPASPSRPRRRSYNRTLPIGIPPPQHASPPDADPADLTFSPSSYPPTSLLLPPPPPGNSRAEDGARQGRRQVDVKGEIISVLDGDGAGWTRHTRVYGGGVCLACAASGGGHGGGFYGATVRPEEMR